MSKENICSAVKDLLSLYAEELTSEETNKIIEKHLEDSLFKKVKSISKYRYGIGSRCQFPFGSMPAYCHCRNICYFKRRNTGLLFGKASVCLAYRIV